MTDESQAMVKKVGLISLGGVLLLAFSKRIFPLVLLGDGSYADWRALFKKSVMADVLPTCCYLAWCPPLHPRNGSAIERLS